MVTVAKLLYVEIRKNNEISTMEDWILNLMELAEMIKVTSFMGGGTNNLFKRVTTIYKLVVERN